ncbi:conserved protein of unknown function [Tenacibaculum sp. 190130A14a]|uniref:Uncharacterized protein n=1 Tax=Tenacibaculum polynesiense TaxID=3137857 RepID=A0ABM9P8R7_9FLAO
MDFEKEVKKIAQGLRGELNIKKEKYSYFDGSREPFETYTLKLKHKNNLIVVRNTIGAQASGQVVCSLNPDIKFIDFEIDTIHHFINLFLRKQSRFKVKSTNSNFKLFLQENALKELEPLSTQVAFDPYIFSSKKSYEKLIITKYHLAFENSPSAIIPLFKFYQKVIDYLDQ